MTESGSSRMFGGIFHKKSSEKRNGENPAAEKKKKHKRHPSVRLEKDWKPQYNGESEFGRNRLTEADGKRNSSDTRGVNQKKKPKNIRRKLPFGKPKPPEKPEMNSAEDGRGVFQKGPTPLESKELSKSTEDRSEAKIEIAEWKGKGDEKNIQNARSEDEIKEALPVMFAEFVPQDLIPSVASECQESGGIQSPDTCPDENAVIIPNPEGHNDQDEMGPSKEIVCDEKRARVTEIFSNFQRNFSLGNLLGLWRFVVCCASDATKQLLFYFIYALIKRYPQCFKAQVKKGKRRSRNAQKEVKLSATTQAE